MPAVFLNSLFISALLRHLLLCAVAIWDTALEEAIIITRMYASVDERSVSARVVAPEVQPS